MNLTGNWLFKNLKHGLQSHKDSIMLKSPLNPFQEYPHNISPIKRKMRTTLQAAITTY